ncbi:probable receptor-like serine/threonine-protein kinase At5g57670 [Phoenix dactylifera]|uniref:Probable receptor-like serine/threonine-protein kinase At5g57670 n=1 Tax=Phoenix dactylifera TaxID=42345 RepID=A0A8B9AIH7_PHODC|nr:probable receptor-like serine/threonine-protein kinase At5g57670 [Phoenix dactylifera]
MRQRQLFLSRRSFRRLLSVSIGRRRGVGGSPEVSTSAGQDDSKSMEPWADKKPTQKPSWRCFSYEEIHKATDGFHQDNLVGRGGYAEVYRGVLEDGQVIAVKRLTRASTDEQKEKDFLQELGTIGHVRHPNVSALLGCCIDRDLHLIFDFSSRGSVSSNLHDERSPPMAWKLRYGIAAGTARGLHYLHKGCRRRIIHRDIKASNILLTTNFEPQISDFGLAKWLPSEWTHRAVAPIEGTFGCLAPEYFMHGIVDEKTDVFAFGVFLLEIISGRKPVDGSHKSLLSWAKPYLSDGAIQKLVDTRLEQDYDMGQLKRLTFIASLCIRATAAWRPSMTEVLELLEDGEEMLQDRWKMPEEEEEENEFWGFDDLDDECDTPSSSSSTRSSQQ